LVEPALTRALPEVAAFALTIGNLPAPVAKPGSLLTAGEPLRLHNVVLLARDGSVTILSSPRAVENYFKAARRPPADPAKAGLTIEEPAVRDLLTAWLTLSALTASDTGVTYRVAPETFSFRKNGPRFVATGRLVPQGDAAAAAKAGERQLLLVLGPDGSVLTAMETAGLKPLQEK
jgi:hypothetical protein